MKKGFWKTHLGDVIVISAFAVASAGLCVWAALPKSQEGNTHLAEICLDGNRLDLTISEDETYDPGEVIDGGEVISSIHLQNHCLNLASFGDEELSFTLQGAVSKMEIGVKKNEIRVIHSDCLSHYCEAQGWLSSPGRAIICAYNHISIAILGQGETDFVL